MEDNKNKMQPESGFPKYSCLGRIFRDNGYDFNKLLDYFPTLMRLEEIEQEPAFHGEGHVLVHTRSVCKELTALEQWKTLGEEKKNIVYLAAMFHDIGKQACTKEIDGVIRSPKHAVVGEKIFRELFYKEYQEKYKISFRVREQAADLIRFHGLPLFFLEKENIEYNLIKAAAAVDTELLSLLSEADLRGRECSDKAELLSNITYFREYAAELGCYGKSFIFSNEYTRFKYLSEGRIWQGGTLYDNTEFDVILLSGLPLSGKDTCIQTDFAGWPVISLDDIREELQTSTEKGSGRVVALARERAKKYLRTKTPFIWNATNISKDTRDKLSNLFTAYGARADCLYIEAPYEELLTRNKIRSRSVPVTVINQMIRKFDMPKPWESYRLTYRVEDIPQN